MKANLASLCYSKEVVLYPKQWRVVNHGRIIYSPWVIKFNFRRTKACAVWLGCCSEEEKLQPKVHTYFPYRVIHSHRLVVLYVSLCVRIVRRKTKKENNDFARGCRTFAICFNEMTTAAVYVIWTFKIKNPQLPKMTICKIEQQACHTVFPLHLWYINQSRNALFLI